MAENAIFSWDCDENSLSQTKLGYDGSKQLRKLYSYTGQDMLSMINFERSVLEMNWILTIQKLLYLV